MVFYSVIVGIYYNMIIAYAIFYFFSSLTAQLPWSGCNAWWNDLPSSYAFDSNFTGEFDIVTMMNHELYDQTKQGSLCFDNATSVQNPYCFNADLKQVVSLNQSACISDNNIWIDFELPATQFFER